VAVVRAALDGALAAELTGIAAEIYQRLADALEHAGDYSGATSTYASAYQFCDLHGQDATGALCRACATVVLFADGSWDRALDVCREVLESPDGPPHPRAVAACVDGLVRALRGQPARARLLEARSLATRIELVPVQILSGWGLAIVDDGAGDTAAAAGHAREALRRWEQTEECHYSVPVLQWASTLFAGGGGADGARACAAALATIAERTAQPEARAALAHALGEVALLDGTPDTAAAELTRAADEFTKLDLPLAAAQAQCRAAAALAGSRDRAGAVRMLRAARTTADRLGADHLGDRIAAALTDLGERATRRRGRSAAPGGLSRREIEVMRLVAMGCTSRQIGTELFLSPRTVEMHVGNSLLKLGCRTRAEAVRHLAELGLTRPAG
jgi:ATP/maltotriose-dependent transcriptional regulator MalT